MSNQIVRIDELADVIENEINKMNQKAIDWVNKAADDASNEGVRMLKATSPVRHDGYMRKYPPGSYAKSWTRKKESNALGVTTWVIYNAEHYQLNHLLEYGHVSKNKKGGRVLGEVGAVPHIAQVNDEVSSRFVRISEDMPL